MAIHSPPRQRPRAGELRWFVLFLAPAMILLTVFVYWPIVQTMLLSLTDWNMITPTKQYVGLRNYAALFTDSLFYKVAMNTLVFSGFTVVIRIALSLWLAALLFRITRLQTFFRTVIFLPHITTTAVAAIVWLFILDPNYGLMKTFFTLFHRAAPTWVTDPQWAMPAIILVSIWKSLGFSTLIYVAALGSVDTEVQEAARIDGASEWQVFYRVTFPLLSSVTLFLVITGLISAIQTFDIPAIMTQGGPFNSTNIYVVHLYELAFQRFRAGYASAYACVFFVIMLLLTWANLKFSRRWVHS